jgi:hypothetical protein
MDGHRRPPDGSHVHQAIDRSARRPALLRQHRHAYAADLQHGLPTGRTTRLRSRPPRDVGGGRALHTGPYPPGSSRLRCYGASTTGSLALHRLTSPDRPAPSGSAGTSHPRRGRLPPFPAFPRSGCPQASPGRCDGPAGTVFHPSSIVSAPRGAQLSREENRGGLEDLVGLPQPLVLRPQAADLLGLGGGDPGRAPWSISAWATQRRSVSRATPSWAPTARLAAVTER